MHALLDQLARWPDGEVATTRGSAERLLFGLGLLVLTSLCFRCCLQVVCLPVLIETDSCCAARGRALLSNARSASSRECRVRCAARRCWPVSR